MREARDLVIDSKYSRLPVYRGQIDNVEGLIYVRDLLACWAEGREDDSIEPLLRPAYFVPATKPVDELLKEMQKTHAQLAIVIDEYGGVAGLVTVEDILEEIVGEIEDEDTTEEEIVEIVEAEERLLRDARSRPRSEDRAPCSHFEIETTTSDHRRPRHQRGGACAPLRDASHLPRPRRGIAPKRTSARSRLRPAPRRRRQRRAARGETLGAEAATNAGGVRAAACADVQRRRRSLSGHRGQRCSRPAARRAPEGSGSSENKVARPPGTTRRARPSSPANRTASARQPPGRLGTAHPARRRPDR